MRARNLESAACISNRTPFYILPREFDEAIALGENTGRRVERLPSKSGPVAQLGARFHGMEEVVGSIPTRSTKSNQLVTVDF